MTWFLVFGVIPVFIMVGLYSKVVYRLWFKAQAERGLSFQQKVRAEEKRCLRDQIDLVIDNINLVVGG